MDYGWILNELTNVSIAEAIPSNLSDVINNTSIKEDGDLYKYGYIKVKKTRICSMSVVNNSEHTFYTRYY